MNNEAATFFCYLKIFGTDDGKPSSFGSISE
jgi:hypothetical protein